MTDWLLLLVAGGLEIVWAAALKESAGFSRPWPTFLGLVTAALSLLLLSLALRSLPVSLAYAVWVGIGTAGVAIYGVFALGETVSVVKLASILLIALGVVGLASTRQ
ncbi:DMT family transporter [Methylibium petroleiphilum]|uniref:DMT family transporter n=1 Tax=Methylibium petroleiphilum TaxID=105560 RepID=UPI001AD200C9|nr:SMR family transporter [Methylibium petroleiphilum]MBN9205967.1 QacE family quaternary ammonium compound efflux SMR transporter [Methylibium petroleiphilum]